MHLSIIDFITKHLVEIVIYRYKFYIYVSYLTHLNTFFSETGCVGFAGLSNGPWHKKERLRAPGVEQVRC